MGKQRIIYLDVIRILACCMIVLMHSPHPKAGNPGALFVPLSFITAAGIGLFFMVSGALLLPIKTDTSSFLKKRFGKIVGPLLFWTLFYIGVSIISREKPVSSLPYALASIPFSKQGHGVLWFLYTLAGLYLLSPIISPFLEKAFDDGEPSGTAGKPILNVLQKNKMENTLLVVVRYFGGIKLGAGGLLRAYSKTASECIKLDFDN